MDRRTRIHILALSVALAFGATGCNKLAARDKLNKGVQAYKAGNMERAIELFKESKELDPQLLNSRLYLATAYASQYIPGAPSEENTRNGDAAIKEFKEVLQVDANNLSAIDGLGSILSNMAGNPFKKELFAESKGYHLRHIALQPNDPETLTHIGTALSLKEDYDSAFSTFYRALELNPNRAETHFNLALALRRAGRDEEAQREFAEAARLNPKMKPPE